MMATTSYQLKGVATSNSSNGTSDGPKVEQAKGRCRNTPEIRLVNFGANGFDTECTDRAEPAPLNIAIVGAGIGGLTAAIGLRRNGHNVSVSPLEYSVSGI